MKSHTISRSLHAVTTAITIQIVQSSGLRRSVVAASFHAARAMIAITAAPTP